MWAQLILKNLDLAYFNFAQSWFALISHFKQYIVGKSLVVQYTNWFALLVNCIVQHNSIMFVVLEHDWLLLTVNKIFLGCRTNLYDKKGKVAFVIWVLVCFTICPVSKFGLNSFVFLYSYHQLPSENYQLLNFKMLACWQQLSNSAKPRPFQVEYFLEFSWYIFNCTVCWAILHLEFSFL